MIVISQVLGRIISVIIKDIIQQINKVELIISYCIINQKINQLLDYLMPKNRIGKQNFSECEFSLNKKPSYCREHDLVKRDIGIKKCDIQQRINQLKLFFKDKYLSGADKMAGLEIIYNLDESIKNAVSMAQSTIEQLFKELNHKDRRTMLSSGLNNTCQVLNDISLNSINSDSIYENQIREDAIKQEQQLNSFTKKTAIQNSRIQKLSSLRSVDQSVQSAFNQPIDGQGFKLFHDTDSSIQRMLLQLSYDSYDSKETFDRLKFEDKKQVFLSLCKLRLPSKTNDGDGQMQYHQIFELLSKFGLLNKSYDDLQCSDQTVFYNLISKLFILFLLRSSGVYAGKRVAEVVQIKLAEFKQARTNSTCLNQIIINNFSQFSLDDNNLTQQQNFIIFLVSVYYINKAIQPDKFKSIICTVLNEQPPSNNIFLLKMFRDMSEHDSDQIINSLQLNSASFIQANQSLHLIQENTENIDQILYRLNNSKTNPQFNGYFMKKKGMIFFHTHNVPNQSVTDFDILRILSIKYDKIEGVIIPQFKIGTKGLKVICNRWKQIKQLYVWDCGIQTLQQSGLQNLQNLQILSLSNNSLDFKSAEYILKHQWSNLIQLRITFIDGSLSWDRIIQPIRSPFPKLKNLYTRGLQNVTNQTFKQLYASRLRGIYVFFRVQESLLAKLQIGGKDWIDIYTQNDIDYLMQFHQKMLKCQLKNQQNQQKIIQNQKKIIQFKQEFLKQMKKSTRISPIKNFKK